MRCVTCNKEINEGAKFCRFCGAPAQTAKRIESVETMTCAGCGGSVPAGAKFCRQCGTPAPKTGASAHPMAEPEAAAENVTLQSNFVTWRILPGQLAVKIDEEDILAYKTIRGVYIAPGTKALFFVNGKMVASLDSGRYELEDYRSAANDPDKKQTVLRFLKKLSNQVANAVSALRGGNRTALHDDQGYDIFYSVVLIRGVEFPLVFDFEKVYTQGLRSDVGLHILCRLNNINDFFEAQLVDKKIVSIKHFADTLFPAAGTLINQELAQVAPQDVDYNAELSNRVLIALQNRFQALYPYITVSHIISLTARHEEVEKIRAMKEELYIAELELEQLQLRNDYMNRLQSVENSNELCMARERTDFAALMDKIDEDDLLNKDNKAQFVEMLEAQARLRQARTKVETDAAIRQLEQTKLLSEEELGALQRSVEHRAMMDEEAKDHEYIMAAIQNQICLQREAQNWAIEMGNRQFENQLERNRMRAQYQDERRDADFDHEKRRAAHKMDLLAQAQALRQEREQAEHLRAMEAAKLTAETELERQKIQATKSFEQIMASNPDISPEAAAALAEKFKAEAAAWQTDRTVELVKQHDEDLKAILAQQMSMTRDIVAAQNQANANMVAAKQQELDRVYQDAQQHQDRFLAGMQTTITAVSGAQRPIVTPVTVPAPVPSTVFCPNCGKKQAAGSMACDDCGTTL